MRIMKTRRLLLQAVILLVLCCADVVRAQSQGQNSCPWDAQTFENETQQNPEIARIAKGELFILPREMRDKLFKTLPEYQIYKALLDNILGKTASEIPLKKIFANTENISAVNVSAVKKKFFAYLQRRIKALKKSHAEKLININFSFSLGEDWRMRGENSERPNDKYELSFHEIKQKVFRKELAKLLNVVPENSELKSSLFALWIGEFIEFLENYLAQKNPQHRKFLAHFYFAFAELSVLAGLKHCAYRAYLKAEMLFDDENLKKQTASIAKQVMQSLRCDPEEFSQKKLTREKELALQFRAEFQKFVLEQSKDALTTAKLLDLQILKNEFLARHETQNAKGFLAKYASVIIFVIVLIVVFAGAIFARKRRRR